MKKTLSLLLAVLMVTVCAGVASAQSLEESLQKFGQDYAKGYVGPIGQTWGAAMNSGWYSTANVSDGIDIFLGIRAMAMPVPDDSKSFKIASIWDGTVQEVPTFFGKDEEVKISGTEETYPKGINFGYSLLRCRSYRSGIFLAPALCSGSCRRSSSATQARYQCSVLAPSIRSTDTFPWFPLISRRWWPISD